jgi:cytochrome P450
MIQQGLALVVLLALVWIPVRLLAVPAPARTRALLALALVVYVALVVGIATAAPALLGPLAIVVAVGFVYASWRARPGYGRARGLPPGSLGLRASIQALTDYEFYAKQARRYGPIFKTSQYYRPVVCVVGLSRAREFLRDHHAQLTSAPLPINRHITGGTLRFMEPDQHKVYRKVLQSCMTPRAIRESEPFVVDQVRRELSLMARNSRDSTGGVSPYDHVDRMVFAAAARIFFGCESNESISTLRRLYDDIDPRRLWRSGVTRRALRAIAGIVREQAALLRGQPPVMPDCFLAEAVHNDAAIADDPVFIDNMVYLCLTARLDVGGLFAWLLKMLCDHPEWGIRLRSERSQPGRDADSALADRFVTETLRLRQSEYLYRTVSDQIQFAGFVIPRGWLLRICIRESHLNDAVFEAPDCFNPDRFLDRAYSPNEYQPFGAYEHACTGVFMTKALARILLDELVTGFDWAGMGAGRLELGLHHHEHWKPSFRFRIRLVSRPPEPSGAVLGS